MSSRNHMLRYLAFVVGLALLTMRTAGAGGASGYLPLNLEPEMERQIERVLILANEPILKRPFPVALVQAALPAACEVDKPLCEKVTRYLDRYTRDYALTHASATASVTHDGKGDVVPNEYGLPVDSHWDLSAQGFVRPNDYMIASAGAIAYSGRTVPVGSMLTLGFNWAQVDVGFRDHWWSPATDSSQLQSTEAPTRPSITVSNWEPLTRLGFQYEFFWERMSTSDHILGEGQGTLLQSRGNPKLFGMQLSIEPFSGWSIGVNRTLQYGGGGLPDTAHFLATDFFKPGGTSQSLGNQQASYISRFIVPAKTPFAVYFQYAGENTLDGGSYLLGEASLTAGIDFPRIWHHFDLTYEISEWQNGWYVNSVFLDGMVNNGLVTGNWGGDQRSFGDGVGARSQMLRIGWTPPFGGYLEERVRVLANQSYAYVITPSLFPPPPPYRHYLDVMVRYSRPYKGVTVGGEVDAGRDVFGGSYSRISGFVRYGGDVRTRDDDAADDGADEGDHGKPGTEVFVDAGVNVNRLRIDLEKGLPIENTQTEFGPHFGIGARRAVTDKNDLGVRLEVDGNVDGHLLLGVRAVDWRRRLTEHFAVSGFLGVARYNLATPAYSLYAGTGVQWRDIMPKWDIGVDFRYAQNVARDHVLSTDIQGVRPDSFYKIESGILYLTRRF
ncbi:MAG TPA: capsule assembly Wzi family protein [Steroidobacteraceae bacterium]|nr:capsule assembly Wzi family protein [Steroidobacteraceae bacterium]